MGLRKHRRAVREAEALLVARHAALKAHWHDFARTGAEAATPGRIVIAGLATGYLSERVIAPAPRSRRRAGGKGGLDLAVGLVRLLSLSMPSLAPFFRAGLAAGRKSAPPPESG